MRRTTVRPGRPGPRAGRPAWPQQASRWLRVAGPSGGPWLLLLQRAHRHQRSVARPLPLDRTDADSPLGPPPRARPTALWSGVASAITMEGSWVGARV